MRVAVIGAGYVGLTTAACFAHLGHDVLCADIDAERVARLKKGEVPILELGLPELIKEGLAARPPGVRRRRGHRGRAAPRSCSCACRRRRAPTARPTCRSSRASPARSRRSSRAARVVVNKSTVPVGSTRFVQRVLSEAGARADGVTVASNPEFLREGQAVRDFLNPDRIVIGCDDRESAVRVERALQGVDAPVLVTDPASAEMIKYASNAFLATKVSFINAIANLCEAVDADAHEVAIGMGYDTRIGFQFLHPGPGYGGSCFPKDVAALLHISGSAGYDFELLAGRRRGQRSAARAHDRQGPRRGRREPRRRSRSALWGLTFKADTDDLRDSPAIVRRPAPPRRGRDGAGLRPGCGRPAARARSRHRAVRRRVRRGRPAPTRSCCSPSGTSSAGSTSTASRDAMRGRAIVDARNLLDPAAMRRRGFAYQGVGRR